MFFCEVLNNEIYRSREQNGNYRGCRVEELGGKGTKCR
jgi:hypothetical protein